MALDPRIALMGRGVEVPDIVQRRAQRAQALRLEAEAAQQQAETEAQARAAQIFAQGGVIDNPETIRALGSVGAFKPMFDAFKARSGALVDQSQVGMNQAHGKLYGTQAGAAQQKADFERDLHPGNLSKQANDVLEGQQKTGIAEPTPQMQAEIDLKRAQAEKARQVDDFGRFYKGYLAENGLAPTPENEFAAQKAFKQFENQFRMSNDMLNYRAAQQDPGFNQFLNEDANRRRPVTNINNNMNPDKVLSVDDAMALGVPFGTTMGEARAMKINPRDEKPMSGDQAKIYSVASTLGDDIAVLKKAFAQDYRKAQAGILLGTNATLSDVASNIEDKIGRLRSGGAINKDEESRFRAQVASIRKMAFGTPAEGIASLERLGREAQGVADNIRKPKSKVEQEFDTQKGGGKKPTLRYNMATGKMEPI